MNIKNLIGYQTVSCGCYGKEYEALVVDNHISQPIICGDCFKEILKNQKELNAND